MIGAAINQVKVIDGFQFEALLRKTRRTGFWRESWK